MRRFVRWLLSYETMDGDGLCPIYLERWTLLSVRGWKFYLHHFLGSDWARDPHDHPKEFLSIGLAGAYTEQVYPSIATGDPRCFEQRWRAPWVRRFPSTHVHRIVNPQGCWTLCVVGPASRDWGFWFELREWVQWDRYVSGKGVARRAC